MELSIPLEFRTRYGRLITQYGRFGYPQRVFLCGYRNIGDTHDELMLRIQYGCAHGRVFGSTDCDCDAQINAALLSMAGYSGPSLFVYFQDHEAYGLGMFEKMEVIARERAEGKSFLQLAREGAVRPADEYVLEVIPRLLKKLGFGNDVVLLSDNSRKAAILSSLGVKIRRVMSLSVSEEGLSDEAILHRHAR